jgi:UDP-N-acetylmuramoyl-L-alanyl-D-glutamate--2,6-diaminopimelate ligase
MLTLDELFRDFPMAIYSPVPAVSVREVVADNRKVEPGFVFVAIRGSSFDGHQFIPDAVSRGAVAVIGTEAGVQCTVPYIQVADTRRGLAYLVAAQYGHPARRMTVIGVTGTDGKTTTTNLIFNILQAAGLRAGMVSTVNAVIGNQVLDTGFHVTTPEVTDVQRYLAQMITAGLEYVVLESTSHGLAQYRVDACEFDIGVVTNITHEHLDYHGSYDAYRAAKGRLFTMLAESTPKAHCPPHIAVLNLDDASYGYLASITQVSQLTYGFNAQAAWRPEEAVYQTDGLAFDAVGPGIRVPVTSHLVGDYNVSNCLAAIGVTVGALGLAPEAASQGIANLAGVPGRMERIDIGQEFIAIVDFAHTPNALLRSLAAARQIVQAQPEPGRVIAVFGSAGLRDRSKRRMMAETSAEMADLTVLTAEDPRTEPLDGILAEMAAGAQARGGVEGQTFWRIPDRAEAIRHAVALAHPGDLVIACGKGHEQSMCFGTIEYAWDDRIAMRAALAERLNLPGPQMPDLPTSQH